MKGDPKILHEIFTYLHLNDSLQGFCFGRIRGILKSPVHLLNRSRRESVAAFLCSCHFSVSLCSSGCPGAHDVYLAGFELKDPPDPRHLPPKSWYSQEMLKITKLTFVVGGPFLYHRPLPADQGIQSAL